MNVGDGLINCKGKPYNLLDPIKGQSVDSKDVKEGRYADAFCPVPTPIP